MDELILTEIAQIKEQVPQLKGMQDEYVFSLLCLKYFYNSGHLDWKTCRESWVDGKDDGGIDLVTIAENESGSQHLIIIQSKCSENYGTPQDVTNSFLKIDQTLRDFREHKTAKYNPRLKRILRDKIAKLEDDGVNFELVLFINADITEDRRRKIESTIDDIEILRDYAKMVYCKDDIEKQIRSVKDPRQSVPEARIDFESGHGVIEYGDNGLLVNVYAHSLKDLYERFKDNGLFEQNFRYFVRHKRIDGDIKDSLARHRDSFWFYNNGVIIGCKDFTVDGNKIKLYDFSIVNGCQTTTLIGEYRGKNEGDKFVLPCKIIRSTDPDFISEIAQASNSQKPISDRDLKSNSPEQRRLRKDLSEAKPPIFLEIKRGELKAPKRGKEDWQFIKNEFLGQLILSFILQQPGTARNGKKRIFSESNIYSSIFRRKHDIRTIQDLVRLEYFYGQFANRPDEIPGDEESIVDNGDFFVLAIIGFMLKVKRRVLNPKDIGKGDEFESALEQDNLSGPIFAQPFPDDFEEILFSLFQRITSLLYSSYMTRQQEDKSVSNFFKTDARYRDYMLKHLVREIYNNPVELKDFQKKYLGIFA